MTIGTKSIAVSCVLIAAVVGAPIPAQADSPTWLPPQSPTLPGVDRSEVTTKAVATPERPWVEQAPTPWVTAAETVVTSIGKPSGITTKARLYWRIRPPSTYREDPVTPVDGLDSSSGMAGMD